MNKLPRVPSAPFSVSGAGARITMEKEGIYVKTDFKPLYKAFAGGDSVVFPSVSGDPRTTYVSAFSGKAITDGIYWGFETTNPSARIRHSFGVGSLRGHVNDSSADAFGYHPSDGYGYVNVIPGTKFPGLTAGAFIGDPQGADTTEVINGMPLYPYYAQNVGQQAFHPGSFIMGGYDGSAANSGGAVTSNGIGYPFAYEASSNVTNWRVRGGVFGVGTPPADVGLAPLYAWARWEIIDPRSTEDSEALLAMCQLNVPQPQVLTDGGS